MLSFTASSKLGKSLRSVRSDLVRLSAALALIPDEEQAWLHRRALISTVGERRLKLADLVSETGLVRRPVQNALVSLTTAGLLQRLGAGPGTRYQSIF